MFSRETLLYACFPLHMLPLELLPIKIWSFPTLVFLNFRDVFTGATSATGVLPKFSDTLTLSPPGVADSANHCRGLN